LSEKPVEAFYGFGVVPVVNDEVIRLTAASYTPHNSVCKATQHHHRGKKNKEREREREMWERDVKGCGRERERDVCEMCVKERDRESPRESEREKETERDTEREREREFTTHRWP
jgi:hypothetical protein